MSSETLFSNDAYLRTFDAVVTGAGDGYLILDQTAFYPAGGGQPGDSGQITYDEGSKNLVDTRKGEIPNEIRHIVENGAALPAVGTRVVGHIDWDRRFRLMRMHTALHLLSAVVPFPVTGGQVGDQKGRLDFDIPEAILDKEVITADLNALVDADHPVTSEWITDEELAAQPELVKTMSVKPPSGMGRVRLLRIGTDVDLQPCGGTHVLRTGEIGALRVRKIEKKGRQNRRVSIEFA